MDDRRPYDPNGDALTELDRWCRKYYSCHIESNDGTHVKLSAGGRIVVVDETDLVKLAADGLCDSWPTLVDLVHESLRLWHADTTPKFHQVMHYGDSPASLPAGCWWRWWTRPDDRAVMSYIWAANERDAVAVVRNATTGEFRLAEVWERTPHPQPAACTEQTGE